MKASSRLRPTAIVRGCVLLAACQVLLWVVLRSLRVDAVEPVERHLGNQAAQNFFHLLGTPILANLLLARRRLARGMPMRRTTELLLLPLWCSVVAWAAMVLGLVIETEAVYNATRVVWGLAGGVGVLMGLLCPVVVLVQGSGAPVAEPEEVLQRRVRTQAALLWPWTLLFALATLLMGLSG